MLNDLCQVMNDLCFFDVRSVFKVFNVKLKPMMLFFFNVIVLGIDGYEGSKNRQAAKIQVRLVSDFVACDCGV
jgi:hypothetical protein